MVHRVQPTRRQVLKRGLFGGALLALGGGGFLALRRGAPERLPAAGLQALSGRQYAVIAAAARRLIPAEPGQPTVDEVGVAGRVDGIVSRMEPGARSELKQLLSLFDNALASAALGGPARPFTRLDGQAQDAVLSAWESSRLLVKRTGLAAVRGLVMAAYYSAPETFGSVGYPGPPQGFHDPQAPVWRGEGPRPDDNGVFHPERRTP